VYIRLCSGLEFLCEFIQKHGLSLIITWLQLIGFSCFFQKISLFAWFKSFTSPVYKSKEIIGEKMTHSDYRIHV
jgi:hypothetical protein